MGHVVLIIVFLLREVKMRGNMQTPVLSTSSCSRISVKRHLEIVDLPLEWFMSAQDYNCVNVYLGMCVCFWYITTVNMFLARLNLSKQHTPSWAVKRADRETAEGKKQTEEKTSLVVFFRKLSPWKSGLKDRQSRWRKRWMKVTVCGQQCVEFQLLLKLAPHLNDWVNKKEKVYLA